MSPKKSTKKNKRGGAQLSGNPQRRAEQLAEREARRPTAQQDTDARLPPLLPGPDWGPGLPGLGLGLGGNETEAGWEESHRRVLDRVQEIDVPDSPGPLEIDSLTCEVVGGVFWEALEKADARFEELLEREAIGDVDTYPEITGFDARPVGWLTALAEAAAHEITADPQGNRSHGAWLLLRGIATWSCYFPGPDATGTLETTTGALMEAGEALVEQASRPALADLQTQLRPVPTSWPLVLHDVYGSRVALLVPFAYGAEKSDPHWYRWDIDRCFMDHLVGAVVFRSREEAVAEWRAAVGDSAPDGAEPRACTAAEAIALLDIPAGNDMLTGMRMGTESRELVVEQYRAARRAEEVVIAFDGRFGSAPAEPDGSDPVKDFRDWYAERNGSRPELDDAATLSADWGAYGCEPPLLYACSPHRIRHTAHLIGNAYQPEYVPGILALVPEWVEWCLEHTGVTGRPADAARAEARRVADQAKNGVHEPEQDLGVRVAEL